MKMILKVLALPVLLIVKLVCVLGNLLTNISSYIIGLLLLIIIGCAIYCIVQSMWTNLAILAGMGLAAFLALFGLKRINSDYRKVTSGWLFCLKRTVMKWQLHA